VRIAALVLGAAALLAGCANPWNTMNLPVGATREEVIARAGQPVGVWPLPGGGQRMQYTLQPVGQYAFMVDLDAAGRVTDVRQVMTPDEFARIEVGKWTREDVDREFGPPAQIDRVTSFDGIIYTYRWYEPGQGGMFYWVYIDPRGVVRRAHPGMDFVNAPSDRNR
jgi:hypothetical protein